MEVEILSYGERGESGELWKTAGQTEDNVKRIRHEEGAKADLGVRRGQPAQVMRYFREELVLVLGTSSSESVFPPLTLKLKKLGVDESVVGLVLPTAYSLNHDGTCLSSPRSVCSSGRPPVPTSAGRRNWVCFWCCC